MDNPNTKVSQISPQMGNNNAPYLIGSINNICRTEAGLYGYSDGGYEIYNSYKNISLDTPAPVRICSANQNIDSNGGITNWKFNAKIGLVNNIYAEYELISLAIDILCKIGAAKETLNVSINNRMSVGRILRQYIGLDTVQVQMIMRLIDKKEYNVPDRFLNQVNEIIYSTEGAFDKFYILWSAKTLQDLPVQLRSISEFGQMDYLLKILNLGNLCGNVKYSFLTMAGAGKYMDTVFEITDTNGNILCSGGRTKPYLTVGPANSDQFVEFTIQESVFKKFIEINSNISSADVGIAIFHESAIPSALEIAEKMRSEGVRVDVDIVNFSLEKQKISYIKKHLKFVLFIDSRENLSGTYRLLETSTGKYYNVSIERATSKILDYRGINHEEDDSLFSILV